MNLIDKLKKAAGLKIDHTNNIDPNNDLEISKNDANDVIFAKTLLKNDANFFYCDNKKDLIKTLKALTNKLNTNLIYCTENILQELLSNSSIDHNNIDYTTDKTKSIRIPYRPKDQIEHIG